MEKLVRTVAPIAVGVLVFSGCMDIALWVTSGHVAPSWVLGVAWLATAALIWGYDKAASS